MSASTPMIRLTREQVDRERPSLSIGAELNRQMVALGLDFADHPVLIETDADTLTTIVLGLVAHHALSEQPKGGK